MTEALPVVDGDIAAAALHGSYCPKMCSFACPVTAATGRDDAVPWSFHRTVTDLASGRRPLSDHTAGQLEACSGCLACRVPCVFDQDVPAQVRAGRRAQRAAGAPVTGSDAAVAAVAAGRSPYGHDSMTDAATAGDETADRVVDTVVVTGCRDDPGGVAALRRLLRAAGRTVAVVTPEGCCGGVLDDLGAAVEADDARRGLAHRLDGSTPIVATDPHCLPSLRAVAGADASVGDVPTALLELVTTGALQLAGAPTAVTYHDPCLLARGEEVTAPPRELLAAAGARVVEPEGSGRYTVCSGAGMALELVAPDDAAATAALRARRLRATGAPVVTACAGARRRLTAAGVDVTDLARFLADRLPGDAPTSAAHPETTA